MTESVTPPHLSPLDDADWLDRAAAMQTRLKNHDLASEIQVTADKLRKSGDRSDVLPVAMPSISQAQMHEAALRDPAVIAAFDRTAHLLPPPSVVALGSDAAMNGLDDSRATEPDPTL